MVLATSDHNVTETAFDAIKCKLSAASLGYFDDPFLRCFVPKPTRRIPLIHRGYYLRHVAMTECVTRFLAAHVDQPVQILSLGAGFDTLFFRLQQQHPSARIRMVEVDCDAIVAAKAEILRDPTHRRVLDPQGDAHVRAPSPSPSTTHGSVSVAFHCDVPSAESTSSYSLLACDLGDVDRLERAITTAACIGPQLPTLVLAECVVSYLAPDRGTALLRWLARFFHDATAVLYDPCNVTDTAFATCMQRYFALKGCALRANDAFATPLAHVDRLLQQAQWDTCRILDMNTVFAHATTATEKMRIQALEPFDEYADWALCNAHYAVTIATTTTKATRPGSHWSDAFAGFHGRHAVAVMVQRMPSTTHEQQRQEGQQRHKEEEADLAQRCVIRSAEPQDLAAVQMLFKCSHLEYACRAVHKFVAARCRPGGDLSDLNANFLCRPRSHFWVLATASGELVGCVGLKPTVMEGSNSSSSSSPSIHVGELCRLSVASAWRRRGVASMLVATLEQYARVMELTTLQLDTIESMDTAQRFYEAHGFTEAHARRSFPGFTLVHFEKPLTTMDA